MIKPILPGTFVSALNEQDNHVTFLLAVKLNETLQEVNRLTEYVTKLQNGAAQILKEQGKK